ncbi:hypothetical protein QKU48_gp0624 [Fadolivirus algeromassiliense]|jgi:hypothetical protein|uniref:Uncharacterized protein n=1 Tax=Fadolivirus FV1/VV64 TaxID=3070911 RepID=A0A7D3R0Z0_9VIRU|nr:hypothetical protein QKU48_gp0624 [Fadolivirus algeromassiliense]QKF94082.1 hypothetical protein Fadolivirus_1_624 [Fadolivirus FV1/VV64]
MEDQNLLYVLEKNRGDLIQFLTKNYEYNYLTEQLIKIEQEIKKPGIITDLFLGKCGIEPNKQMAFYELPTFELLTIIKAILEYINIKNVEEIGAGVGLLSAMLKHHYSDLSINTTDGNRWIETSSNKKYCNVNIKLFLEYCLDSNFTFDNKLLLISWIPQNELSDFITLIKKKKPKHIIIIGDIANIIYTKIFETINTLNYKFVGIPSKQICYRDHYTTNNFDRIKSTTIFATNDNTINIKNLLLMIKTKYENCLSKKRNKINDIELLQDLIIKNFKSKFLLDNLNESTYKKLYKEIYYMSINNYKIPEYIYSYDEYQFWFNRMKHKKYPLNINSRDKFEEYYSYIDKLNSDDGFYVLINHGIIPEWISDNIMADKFLFVEFSTVNKKWKCSNEHFINEFRRIMTRVNR